MVTVGKAGYWIYISLVSKPRRVYLVAMWILCGELRELYAPWTSAAEGLLMTATLDLVRDVVIGGDTGETARRGVDLAEAWDAFSTAHEAEAPSGGLVNTWAPLQGWPRRSAAWPVRAPGRNGSSTPRRSGGGTGTGQARSW